MAPTSRPSTGSKADSSSPKLSHEALTQLELSEVESHSSEEDAALFEQTLSRIQHLVTKNKDEKVEETRNELALCTLLLRRLNRISKHRTKLSKERALAFRQELDQMHLQLQNLNYELGHLNREIDKCDSFRSKDEEIELVSLEDFYRLNPKADSECLSDEHELRLARLAFEKEQRTVMTAELKGLLKEKSDLEAVVVEKKAKLDDLGPQLDGILEKTLPLQRFLELPLSDKNDQRELSNNLPAPLFVIWSQFKALELTCSDGNLSVRIEGNLEEAKAHNCRMSEAEVSEDDDESDNEDDDGTKASQDEKPQRHGSAKKKSINKDTASNTGDGDQSQTELFKQHPLHISCYIKSRKYSGTSINLKISFLHKVQLLTVDTDLILSTELKDKISDSGPSSEVLANESLLCHLMNSDDGLGNENAVFQNILGKFGIKKASHKLGKERAFRWLQTLGGLETVGMPKDAQVTGSQQMQEGVTGQFQVENLVRAIKRRLSSRLSLQQQLETLLKAKASGLPPELPESLESLFPKQLLSACRIRNWTAVDYSQYIELEVTQHLVLSESVSKDDFFYRLQIDHEKHSASLIALIAVPPSFPRSKPVFCLNLHFGGRQLNLKDCEDVRDLEAIVNKDINNKRDLLLAQVAQLIVSLDVMLDVWKSEENPKVPKSKPYLQARRGKKRLLPLKYRADLGLYGQ